MADYPPSPNAWQQQDPLVLIVSEAGIGYRMDDFSQAAGAAAA